MAERKTRSDSPKNAVTKKTGFEPEELLKAPVKPPELKEAKEPHQSQFFMIIVGLVLILAGVLVWPLFGTAIALTILAVSAVFIAIGTLVRTED